MTTTQADASGVGGVSGSGAGVQRTRVNVKWSAKVGIFFVLMIGLLLWGLIDALIIYPKRGANAAEQAEWRYLVALETRISNPTATVADPASTLATLRQRQADGAGLTEADASLLRWLTQLRLIGRLDPKYTSFPRTDFRKGEGGATIEVLSADARRDDLAQKFTTAGKAARVNDLSWYDIPSQWLFAFAGAAVGAYLLFLLLRAYRKVYTWDPSRMALTLPEGQTLTPADINDFDKTDWHKYFIKLGIAPAHPTLGGKSVKLDLLRHVPLEEWVLAMEADVKRRAGDGAGGGAGAGADSTQQTPTPASS